MNCLRTIGFLIAGFAASVCADNVAAQTPTPKQIIAAALRVQSLPRTVHSSCASVGSDFSDRTIGDYLASLLGEFAAKDGKQWVEASCKPSSRPEHWDCSLTLYRHDQEDEWGRGLDFSMTRTGHKVLPATVRCTGGG